MFITVITHTPVKLHTGIPYIHTHAVSEAGTQTRTQNQTNAAVLPGSCGRGRRPQRIRTTVRGNERPAAPDSVARAKVPRSRPICSVSDLVDQTIPTWAGALHSLARGLVGVRADVAVNYLVSMFTSAASVSFSLVSCVVTRYVPQYCELDCVPSCQRHWGCLRWMVTCTRKGVRSTYVRVHVTIVRLVKWTM